MAHHSLIFNKYGIEAFILVDLQEGILRISYNDVTIEYNHARLLVDDSYLDEQVNAIGDLEQLLTEHLSKVQVEMEKSAGALHSWNKALSRIPKIFHKPYTSLAIKIGDQAQKNAGHDESFESRLKKTNDIANTQLAVYNQIGNFIEEWRRLYEQFLVNDDMLSSITAGKIEQCIGKADNLLMLFSEFETVAIRHTDANKKIYNAFYRES